MAHNKSNSKTPSSRSGYLTELTASTGKQSNLLLPVRIKFTPNRPTPLSDGKKNFGAMMKPVLIKDLFPSTKKERRNTIAASATTQKKRISEAASSLPYLNTQSCYKPKKEDEKSTFFNRRSSESSKVRRQLYQSPSKSEDTSKKKISKNEQKKEKITINKPKEKTKDLSHQDNEKGSNLLPPNSIKNNFMRRSETIFKPPSQQNLKRKTLIINKNSKNVGRVSETAKVKNYSKSTFVEAEVSGIDNFSSLESNEKELHSTKDVSTMTSLSNLNEFERPSVIMSPHRIKSVYTKESSHSELQNLNMNKTSCQCTNSAKATDDCQTPLFNLVNINSLDINNLTQLKYFLDQSYKACEDQTSKLKQSLRDCENQALVFKQTLSFVDNLINDKSILLETDDIQSSKKCDQPGICVNLKEDLNTKINGVDNSFEENSKIIEKLEVQLSQNDKSSDKTKIQSPKKAEDTKEIETVFPENEEDVENKFTEILITCDNIEKKSEENHTKLIELSTIGEVSCESDRYSCSLDRYSSSLENKENLESSLLKTTSRKSVFKTPKSQRRKSAAFETSDFVNRRRSARLASRRLSIDSISDSPKDDSFVLLENELNVTHEMVPPKSKSMPASPLKPPLTPSTVRQWDKRVQRPLKEYMALKMNGTFLVTPDAKRFQSCLEPTDTPHSRKSLSRKIFMELCDLYAESPEHD